MACSDEDWDNPGNTNSGYAETSKPSKSYYGNRNRSNFSNNKRGDYGNHSDSFNNRKEPRRDGGGGGGGGGVAGSGGSSRRNYDFNETIDVHSACFGLVIGRGGSNIQRVQNQFNVNVRLDKDRGSVSVSGNTTQDVQDALDDIQKQINKSNDRQQSTSSRGQSKYKNDSYNSSSRRNYRNFDEVQKPSSYGHEEKIDYDNDAAVSATIDWDALNKQSEVEQKARWARCPELTKNFYNEHPDVTNLTKEEIEQIRMNNNNITVSRVFEPKENEDANIPNPIYKFEHCFDAYPDLLDEIYKQNFSNPSPIQAQAWPVLLKGEDMIGIAQTGTGKTLAFLLPAMIHTEYQSIPRSQRHGPNVLIMAPTRELALQIEKEVNKYSFRGMKAVCVYGGGNRNEQISDVESGVEIIICTPGRLNDLIQAKVIDVSSITYLVLDEADRMLDMGFEPQIRKVLLDIRPDRQTVMTSATWPPGVRRLAQSYMDNPIQVCVGSLDLAATHTVRQTIEIMDDSEKFYKLKSFVQNMDADDKIIIFCGMKVRADDLSSDLCLDGIACQCIHGSREQSDREQAIADITSGEVRILIATDVASRGLDIEDITHVINFDFPRNIEEYVHRVGRTGRAGRTGTSISYITREDWGMAAELISILEEADQEVPDELREMAKRFAAMKERRNAEYDKCGLGRRGGGGRGRGGGDGGSRWNRY